MTNFSPSWSALDTSTGPNDTYVPVDGIAAAAVLRGLLCCGFVAMVLDDDDDGDVFDGVWCCGDCCCCCCSDFVASAADVAIFVLYEFSVPSHTLTHFIYVYLHLVMFWLHTFLCVLWKICLHNCCDQIQSDSFHLHIWCSRIRLTHGVRWIFFSLLNMTKSLLAFKHSSLIVIKQLARGLSLLIVIAHTVHVTKSSGFFTSNYFRVAKAICFESLFLSCDDTHSMNLMNMMIILLILALSPHFFHVSIFVTC